MDEMFIRFGVERCQSSQSARWWRCRLIECQDERLVWSKETPVPPCHASTGKFNEIISSLANGDNNSHRWPSFCDHTDPVRRGMCQSVGRRVTRYLLPDYLLRLPCLLPPGIWVQTPCGWQIERMLVAFQTPPVRRVFLHSSGPRWNSCMSRFSLAIVLYMTQSVLTTFTATSIRSFDWG